MRTVLIGSDFMYDTNGDFKLLEINTAVGWDMLSKIEDDADCLNLDALDSFVKSKNFTNIHYIGDIQYVNLELKKYCENNSITYEFHAVGQDSITVPYIEDNEETLIIRSSYDTTALVDDSYCRDKVNFMNLIQGQSFGSQFAYMNETGDIVNNITEIKNNGIHPNYILKSRYPGYDSNIYPKLFKVSDLTELNTVITNNVTSDYFLMEFYVNEENAWNGHLKIVRSLNILTPPNLESIQLGQYTKINANSLLDNVTYNATTFELDATYRNSYVSVASISSLPKVLDTDLIELADGTFKTPSELVIGDLLKTIDVPNPTNADRGDFHINYNITYNELLSGTTYSTNALIDKKRINTFVMITAITFDDGGNWYDTENSYYLINRNDNIQFEKIESFLAGDKVLLIDTSSEQLSFIEKIVVSLEKSKIIFSGWEIEVEGAHLFLTKNPDSAGSYPEYVTIEHNAVPCPVGCQPCSVACGTCPKTIRYCIGYQLCSTNMCI